MIKAAEGILVFDDFFPEAFRAKIEALPLQVRYDIAFPDRPDTHERYINGAIEGEELQQLGIFDELRKTPLAPYVDYRAVSATLNFDTPGTPHYCHIHTAQFVFLYYPARTWKHEWGGETLFFDQQNREIIYASPYVPNRAIFFEGLTPHTIRAPTTAVPHPRTTFGIFFQKKQGPFEEIGAAISG